MQLDRKTGFGEKDLSQRTSEWIEAVDQGYLDYYVRQFQTPYHSTIAFAEWLRTLGVPATNAVVADIGCGAGAALNYLAGEFPKAIFRGIDISESLINIGRKLVGRANASLLEGDLYNLGPMHKNSYDGVISLQTLSWLPNFQEPLRAICALNPSWIALSSLFYDGPVSCSIEVQDYTQPLKGQSYKQAFYNIYSLPLVEKALEDLGYSNFSSHRFELDVDLTRPANRGMGTYTETLVSGARLQISGPLLMSWYFVFSQKKGSETEQGAHEK